MKLLNTTALLIVAVIVMAGAVVWTVIVGSSLSRKEATSTYSVNPARKLGRLLAMYAVVIVAVIVIFLAIMNQ
ncbi:hypothetical protein ACFPPD_26580 [Cohnella suwonensis]|uniref:Uncharacterized protein n=1 Tax=Cohnella suwonensis TaxID=696072 RepID=A0ABW0M3V2_9BACL